MAEEEDRYLIDNFPVIKLWRERREEILPLLIPENQRLQDDVDIALCTSVTASTLECNELLNSIGRGLQDVPDDQLSSLVDGVVLLAIKNRLHVLDEAAKAPASLRSARAQEVKDPLFGRKQRSKRYRSPTPFPIIKEDSSEEEVEEETGNAVSTDGFEVAAGEQDAEVEDSQRGTP